MTIDERLEKLAERHDALLKKLGSMARDKQQTKVRIDGLQSSRDEMSVSIHGIAEATARLLNIAQIRYQRITCAEREQ